MIHKEKKPDIRQGYSLCLAAAGCMAAVSLSLMLSPLVNYSKDRGNVVSGLVLSFGTWALVAAILVLLRKLKGIAAAHLVGDTSPAAKSYRRGKPGIVCFASNVESVAAEITFGLGLVLWVLRAFGLLQTEGPLRMLQYSLCIGGFLLHCFFNGRTYIYIKRNTKKGKRGTNT